MRPIRAITFLMVKLATLTLSQAGSGEWIEHAKGSSWAQVPGNLATVSATVGGLALGTDPNNGIWRGGARGWTPVPGNLVQVDSASVQYAVGIAVDESIWRYTGTTWAKLDGAARWATINAEGDMWVVTGGDDIFRRTCNGWEPFPGKLTMLSAGPNGELWGVSRAHEIWRFDGANWMHVKGILAKTVAISKDGRKVAAIDLDGYMFGYNPEAREWEQLPGAEDFIFEDLAPSSRGIIALNEVDEIFELVVAE